MITKPLHKCLSKWIEIDLDQLKRNISLIKDFIKPALYCLPIKANAYGHGIVEIAKAADGVDYLAVSSLEEGIALREANIEKPILILGAFLKEQIESLIDYKLEFSVSSIYKLKLIEKILAQTTKKALVHLKIEVGMQRVGARPQTGLEIFQQIQHSPNVLLKGIYSHLSHSEEQDQEVIENQIEIFKSFIAQIDRQGIICHLLNSGNILNPFCERFDMVRVGLLSFGFFEKPLKNELSEIKSFFSLKSRITYFKVVDEGCGISYGHSYKTDKRSRFVTIPIGYGDGYRRDLSNKGEVLIRGKRFPIRGNICMDQLLVEIGDGEAYVGDEVVLIGKQEAEEITVDELAKHCNTIPYEILCGFNQRVQRLYLE